ncbi:HAD hydrolase family protein [Isobaculum melis]|uniref:Haloacid dehalogenase-like hydrolase n=1 Tax=Isobaculum melis TaxID=142588 RepID=A0A1H9T1K0_9LACT|nr:HAD hydrolase family protein [Isobaculum melis]SER91011.1 haloacid dehalogenase-like hydrolase [Isobaculum melis]
MYQGVIFLDIEKMISKNTFNGHDLTKEVLLSMQNNAYLLVVCSPYSLEITRYLIGIEFKGAFILFNGGLVALNGQQIANLPIASSVINEIKEVSKHMQHQIAYYTSEAAFIDDKNDVVERFQEIFPVENFKQINTFNTREAIYQLRIFSLEDKKDVLYETFFEQTLDCQRQDLYSLLVRNKKNELSKAMLTLLNQVMIINRENIYYFGNQLVNVIEPIKKIKDLSKTIYQK